MILLIRHGFIPCSSLFNFSYDLSTSAASPFLPLSLSNLIICPRGLSKLCFFERTSPDNRVRLCNPYHLVICVNSVLTSNYIWNYVELRRMCANLFIYFVYASGYGVTVRSEIGVGGSVAKDWLTM